MSDNNKMLVEAVLASGVVLPSPPAALIKLQSLMATDHAGPRELAEAVSHDPALTGALMRVANSPVFRPRNAPRTVFDALMLLGRTRTLAVAASTALRQHSDGLDPKAVEYIWACSGAAADATFRASRACSARGLSDLAYLAALVQDAGITVILRRFSSQAALFRSPQKGLEWAIGALEAASGADHAAVAYLVAKNWKLPGAIPDALELHHQPLKVLQATTETMRLAILMAMGRWLRDGGCEDPEFLGEEMLAWIALAENKLGLDADIRSQLRAGHEF